MADHVWNLRSERSYRVIDAAIRGARRATGFRVVHFTVLGNHLHLIVQADGPGLLASGMRSISIRLAHIEPRRSVAICAISKLGAGARKPARPVDDEGH